MPIADLTELQLYYELSGPLDGLPLVLIHGSGCQMIEWPPGFLAALELEGFRVINFDNRDVGLSSKLDDATGDPPYTLVDMARDVAQLLDHLGYASAHIVGQSMGGMVAQQVAISCPLQVRSLTSVYSAPNRDYGVGDAEASELRALPPARSREEAIERRVRQERVSGAQGYDADWIEKHATALYDRCYCPDGARRQSLAARAAPDRTAALANVSVPTAVIHGLDDRYLSPSGGIATATAIPGAELHLYAGMGHQLVPWLWSDIARVIARTAHRAEGHGA